MTLDPPDDPHIFRGVTSKQYAKLPRRYADLNGLPLLQALAEDPKSAVILEAIWRLRDPTTAVRVRAHLFVQNAAGGWNEVTYRDEWGIADDSREVDYTTTNYTFISFTAPYRGTYRVLEEINWLASPTVAYSGHLGAVLNMGFAPGTDCRI